MRIGLNLLYLIPGVVGGTETYAMGLIDGLARLDTDDEFILYVNREAQNIHFTDSPRFTKKVCGVNATNRVARYAFEQTVLPWICNRDGIDLLHSLGYVGPVYPPCTHVVSIHDMNYLDIPGSVRGIRQKALSYLVGKAARRAQRIITMSEFSRSRIIHHLRIDPDRVIAIHLAPRTLPGSNAPPSTPYAIDAPYIIAFSSPFPHKNIPRLIQAFGRIADRIPHQLVLIGHLPADRAIPDSISQAGMGKRVVITGYVPDGDVEPLIRGADLFVFPSVYEGFGLPVLEAQRAGVPVIVTNAASVPEIAGENALYFDPLDLNAIAAAIVRVLESPDLAEQLRRQGEANVSRFSWLQTAMLTHKTYGDAAVENEHMPL